MALRQNGLWRCRRRLDGRFGLRVVKLARHGCSDRRLPVTCAQTLRAPAWSLFQGDALDAYPQWAAPAAIVSDGACGVGAPRGRELVALRAARVLKTSKDG